MVTVVAVFCAKGDVENRISEICLLPLQKDHRTSGVDE